MAAAAGQRLRLDAPVTQRAALRALDGIRGLAILAVMAHHSAFFIPATGPVQASLKWLCSLGWAGVDLFFVLSGFLITGILLDTRPAANYFQSFYARRSLRIFPLYVAFLAAALLVFPWFVEPDWLAVPADRWLYLCYLTNWLELWSGPWRHSVMAHLWSLAVEEQFYLCWPLVVRLARPALLLPLLLSGEAGVVAFRAWRVAVEGPSQALALATWTRMDGLLLGAACAVLVRSRVPQSLRRALPWLAGGSLYLYLALAIRRPDAEAFNQTIGIPLLALSFALLVWHAAVTDGQPIAAQRTLRWRPLTNTGKYSYGIYVFHVPILYFQNRLLSAYLPANLRAHAWFGLACMAMLIAISYFAARLSYVHFESPFLRWKDRFAARAAS